MQSLLHTMHQRLQDARQQTRRPVSIRVARTRQRVKLSAAEHLQSSIFSRSPRALDAPRRLKYIRPSFHLIPRLRARGAATQAAIPRADKLPQRKR